jgi:hypothetical protein
MFLPCYEICLRRILVDVIQWLVKHILTNYFQRFIMLLPPEFFGISRDYYRFAFRFKIEYCLLLYIINRLSVIMC